MAGRPNLLSPLCPATANRHARGTVPQAPPASLGFTRSLRKFVYLPRSKPRVFGECRVFQLDIFFPRENLQAIAIFGRPLTFVSRPIKVMIFTKPCRRSA